MEFALPLLRFTFGFEAALTLLLSLPGEISVAKLAVPCACFFVLTLIRERVASMYELTYVYNLDEMLKLYDLIMMQRDIEYSRSQKERGGDS